MHVISVVFKVKPEAVEDFREAVQRHAKNSLEKEEGCQRFDVCIDESRPDTVFLYEVYSDQAAFDHHRGTDHLKQFGEISAPMLVSREIESWRLLNPA